MNIRFSTYTPQVEDSLALSFARQAAFQTSQVVTDLVVLSNETRTTSYAGTDIINPGFWTRVMVGVVIQSASGTGGLSPRLQWAMPEGGTYADIARPSFLTTSGTKLYGWGAGFAGTPGGDWIADYRAVIPSRFRVYINHLDSSSYTYAVYLSAA